MGQSYRKRSSAPAAPPTSSDCGPMYRLQGRSMLPGKIVLSSPGTAGSTTDVKILGEFEAQQGDDVLTEDRLHEGTVTKGGPGRAYAAFDVPKDAAQADVFNTYLSTGPGVLVGDKGELHTNLCLPFTRGARRCRAEPRRSGSPPQSRRQGAAWMARMASPVCKAKSSLLSGTGRRWHQK